MEYDFLSWPVLTVQLVIEVKFGNKDLRSSLISDNLGASEGVPCGQ